MPAFPDFEDLVALARRLRHVRWIAGGTGTGKTTLARALAKRYQLRIYDGDLAERSYASETTPFHQPYMSALLNLTPWQQWIDRTPEEIFQAMPSLHGETFGFVIRDLLELPGDRIVLVDDFRTLPNHVAPLLSWPEQAVFLLPTTQFREAALADRYADPARAKATWGDANNERALANRVARDGLWDREVARQAFELNLPLIFVNAARSVDELTQTVASHFRLEGCTG